MILNFPLISYKLVINID